MIKIEEIICKRRIGAFLFVLRCLFFFNFYKRTCVVDTILFIQLGTLIRRQYARWERTAVNIIMTNSVPLVCHKPVYRSSTVNRIKELRQDDSPGWLVTSPVQHKCCIASCRWFWYTAAAYVMFNTQPTASPQVNHLLPEYLKFATKIR